MMLKQNAVSDDAEIKREGDDAETVNAVSDTQNAVSNDAETVNAVSDDAETVNAVSDTQNAVSNDAETVKRSQ